MWLLLTLPPRHHRRLMLLHLEPSVSVAASGEDLQ